MEHFPQIIQQLTQYRYLLLFPFTIIEGPIVTIIAGLLVSLDKLNFLLTFLIVILGDLTGDCLYYLLGRWGKDTFIKRWGKYIGLTERRLSVVEKHFEQHSGKTLIAGKLSHGIGAAFLVAAGVAKMPFWKFLWFNTIATLPKSLILMLVGFYFGYSLTKINTALDFTAALLIGIAISGFIGYLFIKKEK